MIKIFKTNVSNSNQVNDILQMLLLNFPSMAAVNFDLEDCDKILRVDALEVKPEEITIKLHTLGYQCEEII